MGPCCFCGKTHQGHHGQWWHLDRKGRECRETTWKLTLPSCRCKITELLLRETVNKFAQVRSFCEQTFFTQKCTHVHVHTIRERKKRKRKKEKWERSKEKRQRQTQRQRRWQQGQTKRREMGNQNCFKQEICPPKWVWRKGEFLCGSVSTFVNMFETKTNKFQARKRKTFSTRFFSQHRSLRIGPFSVFVFQKTSGRVPWSPRQILQRQSFSFACYQHIKGNVSAFIASAGSFWDQIRFQLAETKRLGSCVQYVRLYWSKSGESSHQWTSVKNIHSKLISENSILCWTPVSLVIKPKRAMPHVTVFSQLYVPAGFSFFRWSLLVVFEENYLFVPWQATLRFGQTIDSCLLRAIHGWNSARA